MTHPHQGADTAMQDKQAGQAFCYDLPMDYKPTDEDEGHYWSWVQAPRSIPREYRECRLCGMIDAREVLAAHDRTVIKQIRDSLPKKKSPEYHLKSADLDDVIEATAQRTAKNTANFIIDQVNQTLTKIEKEL